MLNINSLKDTIHGQDIIVKTIKDNLLPNREIAKRLIKDKNPNLSEESANLIAYGEKNPKKDDNGNLGKSDANLDNSLNDIKNNNQKKYRYISSGAASSLPKDKIFDEVEELKSKIIDSSMILSQKSTRIAIDLPNLVISIANAAPAFAAYVAAFNVPGAINALLAIIAEFSRIKMAFNDLLPHLDILQKLNLVIKDEILDSIINTINAFISTLNTLFGSFNSLSVDKISGAVKASQSSDEEVKKLKSDLEQFKNNKQSFINNYKLKKETEYRNSADVRKQVLSSIAWERVKNQIAQDAEAAYNGEVKKKEDEIQSKYDSLKNISF